jgi:hypothetical protein
MADTYLERLHAQRDALMAAIDEAVPGAATASYSLSDSDGTQSETRRDLESLYKALDRINALITKEEKVSGSGGLRYVTMRRG